jgi:hypothetical protein
MPNFLPKILIGKLVSPPNNSFRYEANLCYIGMEDSYLESPI